MPSTMKPKWEIGRRVRDQPFHVGLPDSQQRLVDDADDGEDHDNRRELAGGVREQRKDQCAIMPNVPTLSMTPDR